MEKKTKIVGVVLLVLFLGLTAAVFFSPTGRVLGHQVVLQVGSRSHRHWSIDRLKMYADPGTAKVLGTFALDEQQDIKLRTEALQSLELMIGRHSPAISAPAVPNLILALKDKNPRIREKAASALSAIGPLAAEAIPALLPSLKDQDLQARIWAAVALNNLGPLPPEAAPLLMEALKDKHRVVRGLAQDALNKMDNG